MCKYVAYRYSSNEREATRRVVRLVWLATRMQGVAMAMGQQKVG